MKSATQYIYYVGSYARWWHHQSEGRIAGESHDRLLYVVSGEILPSQELPLPSLLISRRSLWLAASRSHSFHTWFTNMKRKSARYAASLVWTMFRAWASLKGVVRFWKPVFRDFYFLCSVSGFGIRQGPRYRFIELKSWMPRFKADRRSSYRPLQWFLYG